MADNEKIETLKNNPLSITFDDVLELTKAIDKNLIPRSIIRKTTIEILDLAEEGIFRSTAAEGLAGRLNKRSRDKRQQRFWSKIAKDFRKSDNNITVLADGDSWFEHPLLYDIIDHLNRKENVAVYSLAYGGDWLDNILFQGEYIDMLTVIKPDVFLVSGGGNDLLGEQKAGIFAKGIEPALEQIEAKIQKSADYVFTDKLPARFATNDPEINEGVRYLTKEFFGFVNIMQWQYCYLFYSVRKKYKTMPILTQGYDYALPDSLIEKQWFSVTYWYQHYVNEIMGSGKWLEMAFRGAKIYETGIMKKALRAMIHVFNEMLIETGKNFEHVYHIDSRGLCKPSEWFDEIHVKNHKFLQVAETYYVAMQTALHNKHNQTPKKRVYYSASIWTDKSRKPTFAQAFSAFWQVSKRKTPWVTTTILLVIVLTLGLLCYFTPGIGHPLAIIAGAKVGIYFLYKILNAMVLARHFSKD